MLNQTDKKWISDNWNYILNKDTNCREDITSSCYIQIASGILYVYKWNRNDNEWYANFISLSCDLTPEIAFDILDRTKWTTEKERHRIAELNKTKQEKVMSEWELFKSYLDHVKSHYDSMETWEDNDKLQEAIYSIEKEICRLKREVIK